MGNDSTNDALPTMRTDQQTSLAEARRLVASRYYDGLHYDQHYADYTRDLSFWLTIGQHYGPDVLELAIGTGRIAVRLVEIGCRVVGLDISMSMLRQAASKLSGLEQVWLAQCDMRQFAFSRQFDLVLLPCSSITHLLTDADLNACLRSVHRHVKESGVFVIDLLNPSSALLATLDGSWKHRFTYHDPAGEGSVSVCGCQHFDRVTRLLTDELEYHFSRTEHIERVVRVSRLWSSEELRHWLATCGFVISEYWGGFQHEAFDERSSSQVVICRPAHSNIAHAVSFQRATTSDV